MKLIFKYLLFVFVFFCSTTEAQNDAQIFLKKFQKAGAAEKVELMASTNYADIISVYPRIKDTLALIKKLAYSNENFYRLRFLFDKIDASIQDYDKNYVKAILILQNSLRHHTANINDSLKCLVELKNMFVKIKNYNKAIELCYQIENNWPRKSDTLKFFSGKGKSDIFHLLGLTEKAIVERKKELRQSIATNDTSGLISAYNDIGVFFNTLKNSDSAEYYFLKAKDLLDQIKYNPENEKHYDFFKGLVAGNLGLAYFNAGKIREAIPLLKKDVYFSIRSNNFESALNSHVMLVKCYLELNDKKTSGLFLDSARVLATEKIKDIYPKLKFILTQAEYYTAIGNLQKANKNYQDYLALNSKMIKFENEQQQQNENISLNVEQKETELADKDNLLQEAQLMEARQKSYQAYLFTGILILLVIVGFLINNNYGVKKREAQLSIKNMQISAQKQLIEQALKDKEILIKEIHHRVKNNLQIITSMLSLQIAKVDDEKTGIILRDARQRISSIALTHQMLYQKENLSNINLGEYVEKLVRQVEFLMPASHIELVTKIAPSGNRLTIDNAVPLGLLINELLTNAYKHAFPEGARGRIVVNLTEDENMFTLKVSDNGIGLPKDFNSIERKTLGMELIYILAEQLDSQLTVENAGGSSFMLKIKKNT